MPTVAIIGAGFSGTLLALHLMRRCSPGVTIKLIERGKPFGCGQAYSTTNRSHLLNVRAGGMSALGEAPDHFLDWLNNAPHRWGEPAVHSSSFVPRADFGAYVRAMLDEEMRRTDGNRAWLDLVNGEVVGLSIHDDIVTLKLREGRAIAADIAILATGNVPSLPPPVADKSFYDTDLYRGDPWAADALTGLDPAAPVMLIGTGLTAVDVVMSLMDQGHTGPIHALSRRGLLPQRHVQGPMKAGERTAYPSNVLALLRTLRGQAKAAAAEGRDWRAVIDAMRPFTSDIWQAMPNVERRRFLRHLRPYWDTHRHRMAPAVADRIAAARASGQFTMRAGRLVGYEVAGDRVTVTYRKRRSAENSTMRVARVINCSGPAADYERIADPLVRSLLRQGLVRPDGLRIGLDVTSNCGLRQADGGVSRQLFGIGPLTQGMLWEMTAVPDIRRQCEIVASYLATMLPRDSAQPAEAEAAFVI